MKVVLIGLCCLAVMVSSFDSLLVSHLSSSRLQMLQLLSVFAEPDQEMEEKVSGLSERYDAAIPEGEDREAILQELSVIIEDQYVQVVPKIVQALPIKPVDVLSMFVQLAPSGVEERKAAVQKVKELNAEYMNAITDADKKRIFDDFVNQIKAKFKEIRVDRVDGLYEPGEFDGFGRFEGENPYNPYSTELLVLNVMVSAVSTLFVIAVCLTAYYCISKPSKGRVQWQKVEQSED